LPWRRPNRLPNEARRLTFRPDQKPGDRQINPGLSFRLDEKRGSRHNLDYFNATAGGDWGDWSSSGLTSAGNDAYDAFAAAGKQYSISPTDTSLMNMLGYHLA
jgi:hypothetical protein